jgi:hypothetical protein
LLRRENNLLRWKTGASAQKNAAKGSAALSTRIADIGITIWRLKKLAGLDVGAKLPVKVGDRIEMWSSERVPVTSTFSANDKIRLGVESPTAGYLYVINSEMNADGSLGDPFLIFPSPVEQYNWVGPGMLVDIPDQHEPNPYFNMSPKRDNYTGELLAVVISPEPLKFRVDVKGKIIDLENVLDVDASLGTEIFSRTDLKDKVYSKSEAAASCGAVTRQLERDAPAQKPCGAASRSLTRDEPPPQSIYRVTTNKGKPAVAFVRLNVR